MKKLKLISFLLLLASVVAAQDKSRSAHSDAWIKTEDRIVIDFHNDLFLSNAPGMDVRQWSPGINAYYMTPYTFGASNFAFAWGAGFSSFNVHLNGNFTEVNNGTTSAVFTPFARGYQWDKHKISANYVEIPIEFRFMTRGRTPFKFSIGGSFGYLVNIHTKTIDDTGKWKFYDVPEINHLRYGLNSRMGFGRISAYGFYSLSPFLNAGRGPELFPIQLGLSFSIF